MSSSPPSVTPAISISGLKKTYGNGVVALAGVDLTIAPGTVVGLLGLNGAGKSTLINILAGAVRKSAGQIIVCGVDQDLAPQAAKRRLGVMFQETPSDPFFTPREAVEFQAGLFGVPRGERRTAALLEQFSLSAVAELPIRSLSGGMRRRLMLAKALVHDPEAVVLDEPTAGVDVELRHAIWAEIRSLRDRGRAVVLTTHYLEEAQALCDDVAIIDQGRIVRAGQMSELVAAAAQRTLTLRFEGQAPHLALAPASSIEVDARGGVMTVALAPGPAPLDDILDACTRSGTRVLDLSLRKASLEDAFRHIIEGERRSAQTAGDPGQARA